MFIDTCSAFFIYIIISFHSAYIREIDSVLLSVFSLIKRKLKSSSPSFDIQLLPYQGLKNNWKNDTYIINSILKAAILC